MVKRGQNIRPVVSRERESLILFFLMFYKGAASKMRFTRIPEDIPIRLSYGEEFFCYLTFFIVPYLGTIMAREQCKLS